jgi:hypothetical protein
MITILAICFPKQVQAASIDVPNGDIQALIDAINFANGNPGPDTINLFPNSVYNFTTATLPAVTTEIVINGNESTLQRDQNADTLIFFSISYANLTLNDLTMKNGSGIEGGGIVSYWSTLTINNCSFEDNSSSTGGAIFTWGINSYLNVNDSKFINNYGSGGAGAIFAYKTTISISRSTFKANRTNGSGGGIYYRSLNGLTITDSLFDSNIAVNGGGAIYDDWANDVTIINSVFNNNYANTGAGLFNEQGNVFIRQSTFSNNSCATGCAIFSRNSNFSLNTPPLIQISETIFDMNFAISGSPSGAGITNYGFFNTEILDSRFINNTAPDGAAILNLDDWDSSSNYRGRLTINNTEFIQNSVRTVGGAIINRGVMDIVNSNFIRNTSVGDGGAIYNIFYSQSTVKNSTFSENSASTGGAIFNHGSSLSIENTLIKNNSTVAEGGGIYNVVNGHLSMVNSCIIGNSKTGVDNYAGVEGNIVANNWWGNATGPTNPYNPSGTGDIVNGDSSFFAPWLTTPPSFCAPENRYPWVEAGGPYNVTEGASITLNSEGGDPDNDPITYAWDLDNDGVFETPGQSATFSSVGFDGPSNQTVIVQVTDNRGLMTISQATVNVQNTNPTATISNDGPVNEASPVTINFSENYDWSAADTVAGFHYAFACDGSELEEAAYATSGTSASQQCIFDDGPSSHTVRARIFDKDGGFSEYMSTVTVNNVSPVLGTITAPLTPVAINMLINSSVTFSDAGLFDLHAAYWDWGDGTTSSGVVTENNGFGNVTGSHIYNAPGVYTIAVFVTDNDGATGQSIFQFIVVYDPNGGFVSGAGSIDSPAGAYTLNPSLYGKAHFGFESQYKKGASLPTGNTKFKFKVADLTFESTTYHWLIVNQNNSNAQFKGTGLINGNPATIGEYNFMIWATDGNPDTFRIKIWWMDANGTEHIMYDNGVSQPIENGNIVVHN